MTTTTRPADDNHQTASAQSDPPCLALIGCGAIAEKYHLPGLLSHRSVMERVILVDQDMPRLEDLCQRFHVGRRTADYRELFDELDGVIVATPPHTHHPICMELLARGIHVLCEKPLSNTAAESREMVAAARESGAILGVNQTRRFFPANAAVRQLISDGTLGRLKSIEYTDGETFTWSSQTGFHFKQGARGVLFDRGVHSLDLVCWWLNDQPQLIRAQTDSFGGPESVATIELQHDQCRIRIHLNWLTKLQNRYRVVGERATVEGGIEEWGSLSLTPASGRRERRRFQAPERTYNDFGKSMVENFVAAINGRATPVAPAAEVIPSMELMEQCYERAERLKLPWLESLQTLQV